MQNSEKSILSDQVFTRLVVISFIKILACIICLCAATWAWFLSTLPSEYTVSCEVVDGEALVID